MKVTDEMIDEAARRVGAQLNAMLRKVEADEAEATGATPPRRSIPGRPPGNNRAHPDGVTIPPVAGVTCNCAELGRRVRFFDSGVFRWL